MVSLVYTDQLARYRATRSDTAADIRYYGFIDVGGAWYILKNDNSDRSNVTHLYVKGNGNFAANWTNRASLTYGEFNDVFDLGA